MSMAAALISFAGCQKNEVDAMDPSQDGSSTFEFVAKIAQDATKTTLDPEGYKVDWEAEDVIYMVTTDGTWGAEATTIAEFTYADGKFTTESTIADAEYTFNAMYARVDQKSYHRGESTTHKLEAAQSQDCTNPTAHIKENDALVGTFTATTPITETVSMTMRHIYTLMQVDVVNNTDAEINVTKFEMTAADADLAGIFTVESFGETTSISKKSGASSTITVNVANGTVAKTESLPVYFVMAPLSNYSGDVTFKVTDAEGKTYTKTVTLNGISFEAGKYNTTPYTIKDADVVAPNVTWDLTQDSYSSETADKVTWTSDYVNLSLEKGESSSPANNFLGGTNAHTRVYKDHVMTFVPVGKYKIEKIEYLATAADYVDELTNSTWTNANVSSSGTTVTVIPDDGHSDVSVTIGAATRFTAISVYYSLDEDYVLPTVESIVVSGQTTEFIQNATFSFDGTVTAIYTNDKEVDVTESVTVSTPDLTTTGTKEVTVTYMDGETPVTAIYEITVVEASAVSGWILTSFADLNEGDQVVIVGTKSSKQYAMSNDNGTSSGPSPIEVTVSGNKLANDPEANVIWYVGEDGDNRIFYATAAKTTWLYCTSTNNGVRVGDNANKTFAWSNDYLQHVGTSRYLGIYNTQDWRCYTSYTTANIANQTFQFYVKVGGSGEEPEVPEGPEQLVMSDITCKSKTETSLTFAWTAVDNATGYDVYFDGTSKGTVNVCEYTAEGLTAGSEHTIAVKAIGNETAYTTSEAKIFTATTESENTGGETDTNIKKISFSSFDAGTQYAQGEEHDLGDGFTLTINGAHLNTQVRLYAGSNATVEAPGIIQSLDVTAGYKVGTLNVYGSTDGKTWSLIEAISTITNYTKYTVEFPTSDYDWVKFESVGAQIRMSLLDITYAN